MVGISLKIWDITVKTIIFFMQNIAAGRGMQLTHQPVKTDPIQLNQSGWVNF